MLRKYSIEGWPKLIEQELRDLVHFSKDVWHETCGVRERFKERLKAADHPRDEARARAKYFPSVDWGIESRKQVSRVKIWVSGARKQLSNLMDLVRKDSIQRKAELQKNLEALKNECQNQIADLDSDR
jgi:vacuolar-type H+-ATPase catalytic subunit A/Vma1